MKFELEIMPAGWEPEPEPPGTENWRLEVEDHTHDWQPVWSPNFAGRAFRCEICWDRTD